MEIKPSSKKTDNGWKQPKSMKKKEYVGRFIEKIRPKKVYDVLCKFVADEGEMSDIDVATEIASVLTHSLVAVSEDEAFFEALDVAGQITLLDRYVHGFATKAEVKSFYADVFV